MKVRPTHLSHALVFLQQPEDVLAFMGNEKVAWKLSVEDTRALLRRRKDFQPAEVQSLQFPAQSEGSA